MSDSDSEMRDRRAGGDADRDYSDDDRNNISGNEDEHDEDEAIEPIGTYAEIPEDPPLVLGPANSLEKKIIHQVEYYFSDINLYKDRYLQDQIREDADGWVSISILKQFNRLKSLTSNLKMIATALRKSESGLLEVSKDGIYTRRSPSMPMPENTEELRAEIDSRTAYAKGFPTNLSLDKIITYFETTHGSVETVFMRRDQKRKFKGSVYVTFRNQADNDKFLQSAAQYGEDAIALKILTKEKYGEQRQEEKKKMRQEKIQKKKEEERRKEAEEREKVMAYMTKGAVLHLSGIASETQREDLKNYFSDFGTIAWVEFDMGDKEGEIRFEEADKAEAVLQAAKDANEGNIVIKEVTLEGRVLEEEEEFLHWKKAYKREHERKSSSRRHGHKRRGDRDDHGHRDKRKRESHDNGHRD